MISKVIFALLNGNTTAGGRVFPIDVPQHEALPALVYQEVAGGHFSSVRGGSGTSISRWQITAIAESYEAMATLAEEVRIKLDGYRGTIADTYVQQLMLIEGGIRDVPYVSTDQQQLRRFAKSLEFRVIANLPSPEN